MKNLPTDIFGKLFNFFFGTCLSGLMGAGLKNIENNKA